MNGSPFILAWLGVAELAAWGVGLLLIWVTIARIGNTALARASDAGLLHRERRPWPPMWRARAETVLLLALGIGALPLVRFTLPLLERMRWVGAMQQPPLANLFAAHVLFAVCTVVLKTIAPHPWFKVKWCLGWYALAVAVEVVSLWYR